MVNHENTHYKITGHYHPANYKDCTYRSYATKKQQHRSFRTLRITRNTVRIKSNVTDNGQDMITQDRMRQYSTTGQLHKSPI